MAAVNVAISDFVQDRPTVAGISKMAVDAGGDLIAGVSVEGLTGGKDGRGVLLELMTTRKPLAEPIVHAYQVLAEPGSIRAWQLHKRQADRLAFSNGTFRVVLYDIRPESPTYGMLNVLEVGLARKVLIRIPPFVVHGVQNHGAHEASFVNLPTTVYDPGDPDKYRLPVDHPGIPYRFT